LTAARSINATKPADKPIPASPAAKRTWVILELSIDLCIELKLKNCHLQQPEARFHQSSVARTFIRQRLISKTTTNLNDKTPCITLSPTLRLDIHFDACLLEARRGRFCAGVNAETVMLEHSNKRARTLILLNSLCVQVSGPPGK
jgi:hypothetical protein